MLIIESNNSYVYSVKKLINRWEAQRSKPKFLTELDKKVSKLKKSDLPSAQQIHEEVFDEMDCLMCANCCKSIPPILSQRDVKRISKSLGNSPAEFRKKYLIVDEDGDTVINTSPCPFLKSGNKCRIYEVRPAACRAYPHSGEQLFLKNLSHHKRNMKYCPGLMEIMRRLTEVV